MPKQPAVQNLAEGSLGSAATHNMNYNKIKEAFDNTLSRDGSGPNQMEADFDLNFNDLLNVGSLSTAGLVADTLRLGGKAVTPNNLTVVPETVLETALDLRNFSRDAQVGVTLLGNSVRGDSHAYSFYYDPTDSSSVDSYPACIVSNNGDRWKLAGPFIVNTIAEAQAVAEHAPEGTIISVHGFYEAGDGGGFSAKVATPTEPKHPSASLLTFADAEQGVTTESFGLRRRSDESVAEFGAENSVALNNMFEYVIDNKLSNVSTGAGIFDIDDQLIAEKRAGIQHGFYWYGLGQRATIFKSHVKGDVLDQETEGFMLKMDGLRSSYVRAMRIDYSDGNGGIVGVCQKQNFIYNAFEDIEFVGGETGADTPTENKRSIKFIGGQEVSTGDWVNYHNIVKSCKFNIAYTHVDIVRGDRVDLARPDGLSATTFCNQNNVDGTCLFERYIIGVNFNDNDECFVDQSFFQQANGVAGVNGGETWAVYTNGEFIHMAQRVEAGPGARSYMIGPEADRVSGMVMDNNSQPGLIDPANTSTRINIQTYSEYTGINNINRSGRSDVNFFGDGNVAHDGSTTYNINVFNNNGNSEKMKIGYNASGDGMVQVEGGTLDLRPVPNGTAAENEVWVADSNWDGRLLRISNFRIWFDDLLKPRWKLGRPTFPRDGQLFSEG